MDPVLLALLALWIGGAYGLHRFYQAGCAPSAADDDAPVWLVVVIVAAWPLLAPLLMFFDVYSWIMEHLDARKA